ncbi:hypothetical protein AZSI13_11740 [Azospira sp. I13]|uniref:tetratricopeptide repeat protein n=1 Tax=Azospira sp. I13 TaxID=1765050 RepID=UPI000D3F3C6A|nr:tetratricopeptide repeat protein [Azospira sp. I13]GBG01847.1 hypothetical protein AZSI13_11740 [Azospira sp. I13]
MSAQNKSTKTLQRHWELLALLPSHPPGRTAGELTEALGESYEVTKRQVERDLADLEGLHFLGIACNDKGKPYGWYWPREARSRAFGLPGGMRRAPAHDFPPAALAPYLAPTRSSAPVAPLPFFGREWLFAELEGRLAADPAATPGHLCVLQGAMGVGKSAFLAHYWAQSGRRSLAYYACTEADRRVPEALLEELIHTISAHLATAHPFIAPPLARQLEIDAQTREPRTLAAHFRQLVLQPLSQCPSPPVPWLVVVDGVERFGLGDGRNALLELLLEVRRELPASLQLILASRPIPALAQVSGIFPVIPLAQEDPRHQADLTACARHRLAGRLSEKGIADILAAGGGSFLYLEAVASGLEHPTARPGALPTGLDEAYGRILRQHCPDSGLFAEQYAPLLTFLAGSLSPFPEPLLCALSGQTPRQLMKRLTPLLGHLVLYENGAYRLLHAGLADWLHNPHRSGPFALENEGDQGLGDWITAKVTAPDWEDTPADIRLACLDALPRVVERCQAWHEPEQLLNLARLLHRAYRYPEARRLTGLVLVLAERYPENLPLQVQARCQEAAGWRMAGQPRAALETLARAEALLPPEPAEPTLRVAIYRQYGLTHYVTNDFNKSGQFFVLSSELLANNPQGNLLRAELLNNGGRMWSRVPERHGEAETCLRESLRIRQQLLGESHPKTGATLNNLGFFYNQAGRREEAEECYLRAIAAKRTRGSQYDASIALAESNLGSFYLQQGSPAKAEPHLLRALAAREALFGKNSIPVGRVLRKLLKLYTLQQRTVEARTCAERLHGIPGWEGADAGEEERD